MEEVKKCPTPHVLFFPLPFQGPVNCMLKLAELFCLNGFRVTFLNTDYIQRRLLSSSDRSERYPNLRFVTVPDGLSEDNPRTGDRLLNLLDSMDSVSKPLFREIVNSCSQDEIPLSCIIVDGAFFYAVDIAQDFGIPLLFFDTISPCALWALLSLPQLIQAGDFPFKGNLFFFFLFCSPFDFIMLKQESHYGFYLIFTKNQFYKPIGGDKSTLISQFSLSKQLEKVMSTLCLMKGFF